MSLTTILLAMTLSCEPVIAGATLAEWRERMGVIDLADPQSARWVPGLIAVVEAESVPWFTRRQAALTLGRMRQIGRDAVPVLQRLLEDRGEDSDTGPQLWSLKALALFGPVAKDAAPAIVRVLQDQSTQFAARLTAIEALSQIGPAHSVTIPTLIAFAASGSESTFQRAAIEALGANGSAASSALPVLVRALDEADENLRREAATALGKLGGHAESAQEALLERLVFDDSPAVQDAAMTALGSTGPTAGPLLVTLLESEDADLRRRALVIFGTWRARTWQSAVQRCWDDPVPTVRLAALEASWQMTRRGDVVASRIAGEVASDDRQIRIAAVRLLGRMRDAAVSAKPVLQRLHHDDREEVRLAAGKALAVLGE